MHDSTFEYIHDEAHRLFRKHCRRKVTQDLTKKDTIEFWVAKVAFELGRDILQ